MKKIIIIVLTILIMIGGILFMSKTTYTFGENKCKHQSYTKEEIDKFLSEKADSFKQHENGFNIDVITDTGHFFYLVYNGAGTLPSGYSSDNNVFFVENIILSPSEGVYYCKQILSDVKSYKSYVRYMENGMWKNWKQINTID